MKISTKVRYATRALIDISLHQEKGPVGLRDIAERQDISEKYLEHLFRQLKASKIIRSVLGAGGGYELTRSPKNISLLEVVNAVEGGISIVDCVEDAELCPRVPQCVTREVWTELKQIMEQYLASTNLAELARRQKEKFLKKVYFI